MKAITALSLILMALMFCEPKNAMSMDLEQFQWKNRLLFLFAPDDENPIFQKFQNEIKSQSAEVENRDLVIFEVLEKGLSRMNRAQLERQVADSMRKRFNAPRHKFTLILIGKDGGTKMKRHAQTRLKEVFELIDSMPMRQNEMRQKTQ